MSHRSVSTNTSHSENVLGGGTVPVWKLAFLALIFVPAMGAVETAADARAILQKSLAAGLRSGESARHWVGTSRQTERQLNPDGSVKSEETKTFEQVALEGIVIRKLTTKNGKPLSADEQRKEDQRVARIAESRKRETSDQRKKRLAANAEKKQKAEAFNQEILDAFDFKVAGEETVAGRVAYIIDAAPRPGYKPREMRAQIFPHVKGRLWIDKQDLVWVKAQADAFEPISMGLSVIAKLDQGAHLYFEQQRMADGAWVVKNSGVRGVAHVAVVKRIGIDQTTAFENYRKIADGTDVDETPVK